MNVLNFRPQGRWMAAFVLVVLLAMNVRGAATIDFVQFTDPHFFEKTNNSAEEVDNLAAFAASINEANRLYRQKSNDIGKGFDFVIVTGDLGIEELTNNPSARMHAVTVVSELIKYSLVTNWLFVPGNNDIKGESPSNIEPYHRFIDELRSSLAGSICISNLCPPGKPYTNSVSAEFQIGQGHFIGFDNACFKSDGNSTNATNFHNAQLANIHQVTDKVSAISNGFAYVFYHIPEVDDPLAVTKPNEKFSTNLVATQKRIGNNKLTNSCWIVLQDVRDEWDKVVTNNNVRGLVAGHLHSDDRGKYEILDWTKSSGYLSISQNKLFICPPIACKRQVDAKPQARGFRTYSIDATNGSLLKSRIIWYEAFRDVGASSACLKQTKGCAARERSRSCASKHNPHNVTIQDFNDLASGIQSIATALALLFGGIWTYNRFVKQRERFPFIEFTADIVPIGKQGDWWIVELVAYIENKGKVQHTIEEFEFDLVALSSKDKIETSEKWGDQVNFKNNLARGSWMPAHARFFFIDPGVKAKYSYIARVPLQTSFLNLHAWFKYTDQKASHTAERTIQMPNTASEGMQK